MLRLLVLAHAPSPFQACTRVQEWGGHAGEQALLRMRKVVGKCTSGMRNPHHFAHASESASAMGPPHLPQRLSQSMVRKRLTTSILKHIP